MTAFLSRVPPDGGPGEPPGKRGRARRALRICAAVLLFLLINIAILPFAAFRGPFKNVRDILIETFTISRGTQFIVHAFFTDAQIYEVMRTGLLYNQPEIFEGREKWLDASVIKREKKIEYYKVKGRSFIGHMFIIKDPLAVRVSYSDKLGQTGMRTSELAERAGAILAINGGGYIDYASLLGNAGIPTGPVISGGKVVYNPFPKREKQDIIGITENGRLVCGKMTLDYALGKLKVKEAVSFMPPLVLEGKGLITEGTGGFGYAPRSAIGQRSSDGAIIFLVIEGRKITSIGATLLDIQEIMLDNGAFIACALDGGSCSTMYYKSELVSGVIDFFGERKVPAAFVVLK